jgi:hypothetical protein
MPLSPPAERKPLVVENATDPKVMLFPNLIAVIWRGCVEDDGGFGG